MLPAWAAAVLLGSGEGAYARPPTPKSPCLSLLGSVLFWGSSCGAALVSRLMNRMEETGLSMSYLGGDFAPWLGHGAAFPCQVASLQAREPMWEAVGQHGELLTLCPHAGVHGAQ